MTFTDLWRQHDFATTAARIQTATTADVQRALARATHATPSSATALTPDDLAALLSPAAAPHLEQMARLANRATLARFGRTMQLFAPLYLTNACVNICTYCGFSAQNKIPRKILNDTEILADTAVLKRHGIDHILFVTGETTRVGRAYFSNAIKLLRPHFSSISMEVQPMTTDDYAALAADGLSAVTVFQETYDPAAYARHHLRGPKANMVNRLETPDRLGQAGLKKIGLGALYGLSDWHAEAWFLGQHLRHLEHTYWRTRYSISFPRLRPHAGQDIPLTPFDERDLVQTICALRLWSPEVDLTLSTRESPRFRDHALHLGITSMSAGAKTNPGGYSAEPESLEQFAINDDRSPSEIAATLRAHDYEPVWKDWDPTYDGATPNPQPLGTPFT
ncbi:2-iminoacetate synthase ThiH [Geminisphaera colitermitum]|uniref:2-iminoacetate synthase ThiH n=1 Tax=Geminisphaera colitermitum TaxID=1148786 RepID=UPI0006944304|nr:2-iminoacetate synthase ThiH [Geminisphaera colitermitum]